MQNEIIVITAFGGAFLGFKMIGGRNFIYLLDKNLDLISKFRQKRIVNLDEEQTLIPMFHQKKLLNFDEIETVNQFKPRFSEFRDSPR